MMRKITYLFFALCLTLLSSCEEESLTDGDKTEGGKTIEFLLNIPEYKIAKPNLTRATPENTLDDVWLLVFDANGLFIERVLGTNLVVSETGGTGTGSFKAQVSNKAGIIHFIANYDHWNLFDDRASLGKDEREIVPLLNATSLVFWGRNTINPATIPLNLNVTLFRNQAKVTVESQASNFQVTGYALANYPGMGTVAPFNSSATPTPFVFTDNTPTMPAGTVALGSQTVNDCNLNVKYMFEYDNMFNNQSFVIIKGKLSGGADLYYKVQFLDANKQPYLITRNTLYKVIIKTFSGNANGSTSFEDAKNAAPSNNIYAEILKQSTSISDSNNNILTVGGISYLFITGGTLTMSARYTVNGVISNAQISVTKVEDQASILSNLAYSSSTGNVTATVSSVIAGQQQATFVVKAGVLSRVITVVSSPAYSFTPVTLSPAIYTAKDQDVALNFNIPSTIPSDLFPIKCVITSKNLYPVAPNKDMQIEYTGGTYKYIYMAATSGAVSLNFKTSLDNSDETITIQSDYFNTASVNLRARHFTSVSVNTSNVVNYVSSAAAPVRFTLSDIVGSTATYPLTVTIRTANLRTTQSGWTAVTGGYSYTYASAPSGEQSVAFTTTKALSYETITISAPGFAPTSVSYDNVLAQNITVTNDLRLLINGNQYSIPLYSITSSNTAMVSNFTTTVLTSKYSFPIKSTTKVSDMVTFSVNYSGNTYYASYTAEQLLASPVIILK